MIPVIDLFAGAGGLGEGFSAFTDGNAHPFGLKLSMEKDEAACRTLELRAFFRKYPSGNVPRDYYRFLKGEIGLSTLFRNHPHEARAAHSEVRRVELGAIDTAASTIDMWIECTLRDSAHWVLAGGPPCQAYSIAGRCRNRTVPGYVPEDDGRHYLYREYLRVLARHWPSVFVMENVPGLLSASVGGAGIFEKMLEDLSDPAGLSTGLRPERGRAYRYRLFSLVKQVEQDMYGVPVDPASSFIIESERYGIPQSRHRVIIMGVREDIEAEPSTLDEYGHRIPVRDVLDGLPRLRSGLARDEDTGIKWLDTLRGVTETAWFRATAPAAHQPVIALLGKTAKQATNPKFGRGGEFLQYRPSAKYRDDWYLDPELDGVCHHETRSHFAPDLHRYLFAAGFAKVYRRSPQLAEFPDELLPEHRNAGRAVTKGEFGDRFRVQVAVEPATTVTSHIARDGHYYIHYDPSQCRSLTVREAARLQTFPDNYYFSGNLGDKFTQIGNAVPPLLAVQIAGIIHRLLSEASIRHGRYAVASTSKLEHVQNQGAGYKTGKTGALSAASDGVPVPDLSQRPAR